MGATLERGWSGDFWGFYRAYARTGIHAATAVAVTVGFGLASFAWWYPIVGLACYVLPPIYLYGTGYAPGDDREDTAERSGTEGAASDDAEQTEDRPSSSAVAASDASDDESSWIEADTPVKTALQDVVVAGTEPYAVGESGVILARRSGEWEAVIEAGPTAESNTLHGIDATAEGTHVWFVGDSGVLGLYDTDAERLTDYSAPEDRTSTWVDIAVVGEAGAERLFLVNGSGEVVRGENDSGSMTWGEGQKPGSGSSIAAVAFAGEDGACCDTSGGVFATADGGESYARVGVADASATFTDLAVVDSETMVVACDDGTVLRYDGERWTRRPTGENALAAIDHTPNEGLAAGASGSVYEHAGGGWTGCETPIEADLSGVVIGSHDRTDRTDHDVPAVAVGVEGTIIER